MMNAWALALGIVLPGAAAAAAGDLRIENVTIVSPERAGPVRNASVRIHDGRIVAISIAGHGADAIKRRNDVEIDGSGLFLTPGLIDGHVHLGDIPGMTAEQEAKHPDIARAVREQMPRSFLLHGFTALVDLISTPQAMQRWNTAKWVPDTHFCGAAVLMDGYPMNFAPKPQRYAAWDYMLIEPGTTAPEGVDPARHTPEAVVARIKRDGAICVKTAFERGFAADRNLPVPRLETIRGLVAAAHAAGLPVLMHANSDEAQRFGLDAGVDMLVHGLWNSVDPHPRGTVLTPRIRAILDDEISKNVGVQPTIQVLYGLSDLLNPSFLSDPRLERVLPPSLVDWYRTPEGQWFRAEILQQMQLPANPTPDQLDRVRNDVIGEGVARVKQATRYLITHHGRVLFGTDTPSAPTYANPPGLNAWFEMQHLREAGESPKQIFESATLLNARAFKLDGDIGTVEVGKRANLLLLHQDPIQTIDAYADIAKVILDGRVLNPSELVAVASH